MAVSPARKRLLVLSHVLPFPGNSGQQLRVANSLRALRERFHVTFLTFATDAQQQEWQPQLASFCDEAVFLPALTQAGTLTRYWHKAASRLYAAATSLKPSNYQIGQVEFAPARLRDWLNGKSFDLALYEYWHAVPSVPVLQSQGIRCVLDMHNILWQAHQHQLERADNFSPASLARYRQREEAAWQKFDALIAINQAELRYLQAQAGLSAKLFHAAMGVNLNDWPYRWQPAQPARLAYYGGLGSAHNQADALLCVREIMPRVWQQFPDTEIWLVGSNPPEQLRQLARADARVHVTGFVANAAEVLKEMTAMLCPWRGTYGFRSRVIEALAVGLPVITTPDAVYGMGLDDNQRGLWLGVTAEELAQHALRLLQNPEFTAAQSRAARAQVETHFSLEATYGKLASDLEQWISNS